MLKLKYKDAEDGISYTFSIIPKALGKDKETRIVHLAALLDGYFKDTGHHININVFDKETLLDKISTATWQYARRQRTWFRHQSPVPDEIIS